MNLEIIVNDSAVTAAGETVCESFREGRCSRLSFDAADSPAIREGDTVAVRRSGAEVFYGTVFTRRKSSGGIVHVIAYDQLRYLKNRDTYVYCNKRASDVVGMIAADFGLRSGEVMTTSYVIPSRVEDNNTLSDIIRNSLDLEEAQSGKKYCLTDMFGKLCLLDESRMTSGAVLNSGNTGRVEYSCSIDGRYNRVKLSRFDRKSGVREVYIAGDAASQKRIGVLQEYVRATDPLESGFLLQERADRLLGLHNKDKSTVTVRDAVGDCGVRGGSYVTLDFSEYSGKAVVTRCVHRFSGKSHFMDLECDIL